MNVYGLVVTTIGFDTKVKLVDEVIAKWVLAPINEKAKVEVVPRSVYVLLADNENNLKYFRPGTNDLVKPSHYEEYKAEIAPSIKDFETVVLAKKYAEEKNYNYIDTIIRFVQP